MFFNRFYVWFSNIFGFPNNNNTIGDVGDVGDVSVGVGEVGLITNETNMSITRLTCASFTTACHVIRESTHIDSSLPGLLTHIDVSTICLYEGSPLWIINATDNYVILVTPESENFYSSLYTPVEGTSSVLIEPKQMVCLLYIIKDDVRSWLILVG